MAQALQMQYTEYTRKKKAPFRNLVASVYKSIQGDVVGSEKRESLCKEENWLRKREEAHMSRRMASQQPVKM